MIKILVLHGPNLNLLGLREKSLYGNTSLEELDLNLQKKASDAGFALTSKQSNSEAELISAIHNAITDETAFIIFNPAAFSHTSIALRDALLAIEIPFIEVHISNIYSREIYRQNSYSIVTRSSICEKSFEFDDNNLIIACEE